MYGPKGDCENCPRRLKGIVDRCEYCAKILQENLKRDFGEEFPFEQVDRGDSDAVHPQRNRFSGL